MYFVLDIVYDKQNDIVKKHNLALKINILNAQYFQ